MKVIDLLLKISSERRVRLLCHPTINFSNFDKAVYYFYVILSIKLFVDK